MAKAAASFRVKGLFLKDLTLQVPLDWADASGPHIEVYAREVRKPADADVAPSADTRYLVYLQGGPGHRAGRPTESGGWVAAALDAGFRVILLDQRGTGRSTGAGVGFLTRMVEARGAAATADYLANFRADSIVRDAEALRESLGVKKWSLLGQSFGGFCSTLYLSHASESLQEVLLTGGLPPLVGEANAADGAYRSLFEKVRVQNAKFYMRFPEDKMAVRRIVQRLLDGPPVKLPLGGTLTARGFQTLGILFGLLNGFETVHYLIEDAWDADGELSFEFLLGVENVIGMHSAPLYLLLHESIYCNNGGVSAWAAERVRNEEGFATQFDARAALAEDRPVLFTGEMMFPWMLDELSCMNPLKEVGHKLAERAWGPLYDVEALRNVSPSTRVASAAYVEDMFVDYELARDTARLIGSAHSDSDGIGGEHVRHLLTSEYNHSGLREDGGTLFKKLLAMARDEVPVR